MNINKENAIVKQSKFAAILNKLNYEYNGKSSMYSEEYTESRALYNALTKLLSLLDELVMTE